MKLGDFGALRWKWFKEKRILGLCRVIKFTLAILITIFSQLYLSCFVLNPEEEFGIYLFTLAVIALELIFSLFWIGYEDTLPHTRLQVCPNCENLVAGRKCEYCGEKLPERQLKERR